MATWVYFDNGQIKSCTTSHYDKIVKQFGRQSVIAYNSHPFRLGERDSFICALCENPITDFAQSNIDHIVPLSKGGSNLSSNKQLVHIDCNTAKGNIQTPNCIPKDALPPFYPSKKKKIAAAQKQLAPIESIVTKIVQSDEPQKLWNEIARNGFKNLSFNLFKEYFERYKKHNPYNVTIQRNTIHEPETCKNPS